MRLYELAKELGLPSKELIASVRSIGIEVPNQLCALNEDQVAKVRELVSGKAAAKPASSPAPAKPAPPPFSEKLQPKPVQPKPELKVEAPAVSVAHPVAPAPVKAAAQPPAPVTVAAPAPTPAPAAPTGPRTYIIRGPIVVKEFAVELGLKPNQLIAELMTMNVFASLNQRIELKVAQKLAERHGLILEQEKKPVEQKPPPPVRKEEKKVVEPVKEVVEEILPRPPVVTFLGHVDHGKTSLLDRIRNAQVAAGEAGGITQHIGAYTVQHKKHRITFLDTPGHAAFTAMRARGANLTDIAVLVVAANDGVMPQTREAIKHAMAAKVCIIVAINKVDLPDANIDRVKRQLQQEGLAPEDWGGNIGTCAVSATTGAGIDDLLERIVLESEVLELKANPKQKAQGYVIEAKMEPGMGPTASLLIKKGTLHIGDPVVCGMCWGKVKALINDRGEKVKEAGPSAAVRCLGLNNIPEAGAEFQVFANEKLARATAEERAEAQRIAGLSVPRRLSLDDLLNATDLKQALELPVILKVDVKGSLEAIEQSLKDIKSDKVKLRVILSGVGNITENDVLLASASNAVIIGFHVALENGVAGAAKRAGVEIRLYSIIYELLDQVRDAMTGLLKPQITEKTIGRLEILQVFEIGKKGNVAGCVVKQGKITSRAKARVIRDNATIFEGSISSLKRFQNDASEVREGQECGIRLDNFADFAVGDQIECYDIEKTAQQL